MIEYQNSAYWLESYRDGFVSAEGRVLNNAPQQKWQGDKFLQTAIFAGQVMQLGECEDGTIGFELLYLGFKSNQFPTIEAAKLAAPKFAINVLKNMLESI